MITLITASPGGGKTISAVWSHIKPAIEAGRLVYVNGIPGLTLPAIELSDEDVMRWPEVVPDGALVVLDEVQRVWRPLASGAAVPESIAKLETHRHHGLDFVIITQHPGLVHRNVRLLVGRHLHIRVTALGRHVFEWPEYTESPQSKSSRSNAVRTRMRLPRRAYGLYRSASVHVKQVHRIPGQVYILGLAMLGLAAGAAYLVPSIYAKTQPRHAPDVAPSQTVGPTPPSSGPTGITPSPGQMPTELRSVQVVSDQVPWNLVAACMSMGDVCQCYGDAGQRLAVSVEACRVAVSSGWGERGELMPRLQSPIDPKEAQAYMGKDAPQG